MGASYTQPVDVTAPTVVHLTPFPHAGDTRPAPGVPAFISRLLPAYAAAGVPLQRVVADRGSGRRPPREYPSRGIEVVRAYRPGVRFGACVLALARAHGDVVHAQHEVFLYGGPPAAAQFPAVLRAGARGRPSVVSIHGVVDLTSVDRGFVAANGSGAPPALVRRMLRALVGASARAADHVIVHEDALGERLSDQYGVPAERVSVIPLPVPDSVAITREDARRARGFTRPTALFFGFVTGYKGLPLLLDAWARYRADGGDGELVVAGGRHPRLAGRPAYEREYAALQQRAAGIGGVRWDGYAAEEDVPAYLAGADALVLPYRDGLAASGPMSLALAYGTPILASDVLAASAPDLAGVAPREVGPWAELLHAALHTDLGEGLAAAARRAGRERSLEAVAQRTVTLYRELAA
jgi:glycosyltransferase involved in cell wall biosynthesis